MSIRAADLLAANEELIRRTRQELEQLVTDANTETYPSAKKVAEMLDVDKSTLWRWAKVGHLVPINVGGRLYTLPFPPFSMVWLIDQKLIQNLKFLIV